MELEVGVLVAGARANEAAGLKLIRRADAAIEEQPLEADPGVVVPLQRRVEADRLGAVILHIALDVILQVRPDAG